VLHTLGRAAPQVVGEVGVVITDDTAIRGLNRRFRAKDAATDVLAFPLGQGLLADEPYGDVVISYEAARRQARATGATLRQEMARLLIHGTLHLCGHDHHEKAQAARMHGLTRRLLREVSADA
jgi:probable rRNA maturation factor